MVLPWVLGFVLFMLGPIVLSLLLSVARWASTRWRRPICWPGELSRDSWGRPNLLAKPQGNRLLRGVVGSFGQGALLAAVILNAKLRGVEAFRAAWYLPSVLAGVGMAVLWTWVFRSEGGLMNSIIEPVPKPLGLEPPDWFQSDAARPRAPTFCESLVGWGLHVEISGWTAEHSRRRA